MAISAANTFKVTDTPSASNVTAQKWMSEIYRRFKESSLVRNLPNAIKLMDVSEQGYGNTLYFNKSTGLTAGASAPADRITLSTAKPTNTQGSVSADVFGLAVQIEDKQLRDQFASTRDDMIEELTYSLVTLENKSMISELTSGLPAAQVLDKSSTTFNTLDYVLEARKLMRKANVPYNYLIVHPEQEEAILKLPELQRVDYSGDNAALREAYIGKLFGTMPVLVSNFVEEVDNAGTPNFKALMLGKDAGMIFQRKGFTLDVGKTSPDVLATTFAAYADIGYTRVRDESVVVITTQ